jgi:hypothetical protein
LEDCLCPLSTEQSEKNKCKGDPGFEITVIAITFSLAFNSDLDSDQERMLIKLFKEIANALNNRSSGETAFPLKDMKGEIPKE